MIDNTITLAVDTLNNGTPTNRVYSRYEEFQNRSVYIGPEHSLSARDTMALYRSPVKKNGNFPGMAKSSIKLTQDVSVLGLDVTTSIKAPMIGEASFSVPVGITDEELMSFRQRLIATLDHAFAVRLNSDLEI